MIAIGSFWIFPLPREASSACKRAISAFASSNVLGLLSYGFSSLGIGYYSLNLKRCNLPVAVRGNSSINSSHLGRL